MASATEDPADARGDDTSTLPSYVQPLDHDRYVELTMHFKCNLKCVHCMIEDTMDWLEPETVERLQEICDYNAEHNRWEGVIFTGSEVTLRPDLPDWARMARDHGFEHVRIQTHGMRLSNEDYCRELIDAGIDEYFVSVTAGDAATHDEITEIPGSFDKTMRGLDNLDSFDGVTTLTNTVITQRSYRQLPDIVDRLAHLRRLARMDFWNFWPMSESDDKDLIANHLDVLPFLREAIARAKKLGRAVEVKNFPECLLADDSDALNNDQPKLIIDPEFWPEFMRNGFNQCVYREQCGAQRCLGLNTAYINKFGWHEDVLVPLPMTGAEMDE